MTQNAHPVASSEKHRRELDIWAARDLAIEAVPRHVPGADADAMRVSITLEVAANVMATDLRARLRQRAGLSAAQLDVLLFTLIHGELELHRITRFARMKKATASALVQTMVTDGLLMRRSPAHDRRTLLFSLTERGIAMFEEGFRAFNEGEHEWISALDPDERATLIGILTKLVNSQTLTPAPE